MTNSSQEIEFFPEKEEKSLFHPAMNKPVERGIARTGARIAETLTGSVGDIPNFFENLLKKGYEKLTGQSAPNISITEDIFQLPTTAKMKEFEQGFLSKYLEPQNRKEEFGDDVINSITSLATMGVNPSNAIKGALLGNGMKYAGKLFNMPEWIQTGLDITGTVLGSSKFPNIKTYKDQLYSEMRSSLPQGAVTDTSNLANKTQDMLNKLSKGSQNIPQKNAVRKIIEELNAKAQGGIMEVEDLHNFKTDIYKAIGDYQNVGGYKAQLKDLNKEVKSTLYDYAKINPEYVDKLKKADKYFGELTDFSKASTFIDDLKEAKKFSAAMALVNGNLKALVKILGLSKVGSEVYNLIKHPKISELYAKALGSGLKQSKGNIINYIRKLDEELRKIKPEEEIEFRPD